MEGEEKECGTPLVGQAQIVRWGGRGAGGHLGQRTGSTWSRADNRGGSRGAIGAGGYHFEGGEEATDRGGGGGAWGLRDFSFVLSGVHLPFLRERLVWGRSGGWGFSLWASGAGWARGVCSGVVITAVGAMGRGGGATADDRAEVAFFGAGGAGAPVLRLPMVESADGADRVVIFADRSSVPVPLTVAAASGFVGGVSDFDFPFAGEEENVGAHLFPLLRGGGDHH